MHDIPLRTDLERVVIDGFALPLGLVPNEGAAVAVPTIGYTVDYTPGEEDEPDTYLFYVVVSHERLARLLRRIFRLLPREVHAIVEISSRDAYRVLDVYMSQDPITLDRFLRGWRRFETFLLENGWIGCGANAEEPFVEIFLDQWKGLWIHVPLMMRDDVERVLADEGLSEVAETWPEEDEAADDSLKVRSVLVDEDETSLELDEMLLLLRQTWDLELNVDPETNVDEAGRELGSTLWHALVIVSRQGRRDDVVYASIWATAASLLEMEDLIEDALAGHPEWRFEEICTVDRVAFDERPEDLRELSPVREQAEVHLVVIDV